MTEKIESLILQELHLLQTRMDARFDAQDAKIADLCSNTAVLKSQMKTLLGNGQPGVIQHIDCRLAKLEMWKSEWVGRLTVISTVAAAAITYTVPKVFTWFHH